MKRVLILGATGMAGHVIHTHLSSLSSYEILNICFRKKLTPDSILMDLRKKDLVSKILRDLHPDVIINCVGVLIQGTKASLADAIYLNSYFPHSLALLSRELNAKVVHLSTDCVFSGMKGHYVDSDEKDALEPYGMTKNLGEIINDNDLTIRTSIIGPELKQSGEGLFHWFMSLKSGSEIDGYADVCWSGITTLELSKFIHAALLNDVTGLYQVSNNESISKYDLLQLLNRVFARNITIKRHTAAGHDKSLIASSSDQLLYRVPSYQEMLIDLKEFMEGRKAVYQLNEIYFRNE